MRCCHSGTGARRVAKVIPLATILGADPAELLREWFEAYMPGTLPQMELYMGNVLSASEASWIRNLRSALGRVPHYKADWSKEIQAIVRRT